LWIAVQEAEEHALKRAVQLFGGDYVAGPMAPYEMGATDLVQTGCAIFVRSDLAPYAKFSSLLIDRRAIAIMDLHLFPNTKPVRIVSFISNFTRKRNMPSCRKRYCVP